MRNLQVIKINKYIVKSKIIIIYLKLLHKNIYIYINKTDSL